MSTQTYLDVTLLDADTNQPEVVVNAGTVRLGAAVAGVLTHAVATDGDYTLTATGEPPEWVFGVVEVTDTGGTLTAGRNIVVPDKESAYKLVNRTAQILTVKTTGAAGIAVAASRAAILQCDGASVFRITADSTVT